MTDENSGPHLTPEELGAYLDQTLRSEVRARIDDHLVECIECRQEAIAVGRLAHREGPGRSRRVAYWVAPIAAAAIAGLLLLGPGADELGDPGEPLLRSDDVEEVAAITAVTPLASAQPHPDSVVFRWRPVDDDLVYQVTLMDESGAVVWRDRTADSTIALTPEISLSRGSLYYWYVDALLGDGRSVTSGVKEFAVQP